MLTLLSRLTIEKNKWEKKDKYLDLSRKLKKLWNMKVTIIPIVIGAFGTVTKGLFKGLEDLEVGGRVETIQTTVLLRTARIQSRVLETWRDLLSFKLQGKTICKNWCEKLKWVNNNNDNNNAFYPKDDIENLHVSKMKENAYSPTLKVA